MLLQITKGVRIVRPLSNTLRLVWFGVGRGLVGLRGVEIIRTLFGKKFEGRAGFRRASRGLGSNCLDFNTQHPRSGVLERLQTIDSSLCTHLFGLAAGPAVSHVLRQNLTKINYSGNKNKF